MKTTGLILIVVALHCAVIGTVCFISGCGTTPKPTTAEVTPVLPPPEPPAAEPATPTGTAPTTKEVKTTGGGEYVVQAGDTLAVIAKRCHVTQAELIEANKLADPNKLKVGQKLILPATGPTPPAAPKPSAAAPKAKAKPVEPKVKADEPKAAPAEPAKAGEQEYIVKAGDSLSKIAAHYGMKVSALREANKLSSDNIKVGQKLKIPAAAPAAPAADTKPAADAGLVVEGPAPAAPASVKGTELAAPVGGGPAKADVVSGSGIVHVVQPNEDLVSVAKLYAVTVDEIVEINQLSSRTVKVGQRLKIP